MRGVKGDEKCAPYQNFVPEQLWHSQAGQGRWQKAEGQGELGLAGIVLGMIRPSARSAYLVPGSKFLKRARVKNPKRSIQKQNPKHSFWKSGRHTGRWKT